MKGKVVNNLPHVLSLLTLAMERAEDLHCMCKTCNDFRENGTGDDLCFHGRQVMQTVYAVDEAKSLVYKYIGACTWDDLEAIAKDRYSVTSDPLHPAHNRV